MSINVGHIRAAVVTMRANRWRSLLTMFGIVVGVASAIVIVSIAQGVKNSITGQVNAFSKNVITVGASSQDPTGLGLTSIPFVSTLTYQDAKAIAKIPGVQVSVPLEVLSGLPTGDKTLHHGIVFATTQNLPQVLNQTLAYGAFFNDQDSNAFSAVLGSNAAIGLFNDPIPLGYSFTWRNQQFVVDGVLNSFETTPFANDTLFNNAVFIPVGAADQMSLYNNPVYQILVKVKKAALLPAVAKKIKTTLLNSHGGQADFSVLLPSQIAGSSTSILNLMTELTLGIAIVSLFVGGVGIMNVMLVSVTERMHEIGIRKAIGASNRQILMQFLIESTTVSIVGCMIGIVLAVLAIFSLRAATNLAPAMQWPVFAAAAVVSILIGIIFGSVPAIRAARKEPIDALRND